MDPKDIDGAPEDSTQSAQDRQWAEFCRKHGFGGNPDDVPVEKRQGLREVMEMVSRPAPWDDPDYFEVEFEKGDRSFGRTFSRAILASGLGSNGQRVALAINTFADLDGGNCFPKIQKKADPVGKGEGGPSIVEIVKLSPTTVHRWLDVLHKAGWVDIIPFIRPGRRQTASLYLLSIPEGEWNGPKDGALRWSNRAYGKPAPPDHPSWDRARCREETRQRIFPGLKRLG